MICCLLQISIFVQQTEKFEERATNYELDSRLYKSSKLKFNSFPHIPMLLWCVEKCWIWILYTSTNFLFLLFTSSKTSLCFSNRGIFIQSKIIQVNLSILNEMHKVKKIKHLTVRTWWCHICGKFSFPSNFFLINRGA